MGERGIYLHGMGRAKSVKYVTSFVVPLNQINDSLYSSQHYRRLFDHRLKFLPIAFTCTRLSRSLTSTYKCFRYRIYSIHAAKSIIYILLMQPVHHFRKPYALIFLNSIYNIIAITFNGGEYCYVLDNVHISTMYMYIVYTLIDKQKVSNTLLQHNKDTWYNNILSR